MIQLIYFDGIIEPNCGQLLEKLLLNQCIVSWYYFWSQNNCTWGVPLVVVTNYEPLNFHEQIEVLFNCENYPQVDNASLKNQTFTNCVQYCRILGNQIVTFLCQIIRCSEMSICAVLGSNWLEFRSQNFKTIVLYPSQTNHFTALFFCV